MQVLGRKHPPEPEKIRNRNQGIHIRGGNKMSKADVIEEEGTVVEKIPNAMFQVE